MADIYEHIATSTLSSSASYVEFTSISADYEFLQVRCVAKTDRGSVASDAMALTFNSGSNYNQQTMYAHTSSSAVSERFSQSNIEIFRAGATGAAGTNEFGGAIIDIGGYADSDRKTSVRQYGGFLRDASTSNDAIIGLAGGLWTSTAVVTSLKLAPMDGSNFVSGSEFSLYGWRNS